ncbi:hypothetical protein HDU86_005074 [Geranomyces michiganensis]|nr:hypothetical protein HDU86_005074 [Geranomyces michiganensis]
MLINNNRSTTGKNRNLLLLPLLLSAAGQAAASVAKHVVFGANDTDCTGVPFLQRFDVKVSGTVNTAGDCSGLSGRCEGSKAHLDVEGGGATIDACIDASAGAADSVSKAGLSELWYPASVGKPYFIATTYDNSIGGKYCTQIESLDDHWTRTSYLADGECRGFGLGASPSTGKLTQRYMRFSCQVDGSVFVRDWCDDSSCANCQFANLVGFATGKCGLMGGPTLLGGNAVVSGYCDLAAQGRIPPQNTPDGYKPPPKTGEEVVKGGAAANRAAVGLAAVSGVLALVAALA